MRVSTTLAMAAGLALSGSAFAAPPQGSASAQDYLNAIHQACPQTFVKGPDGVPQPVVSCSRGFSLATSGSAPPSAPKAHGSPRRRAAAPSAGSSLLSNLLITFRRGSAELTDRGRENADHFAEALKDPSVSSLKFEIAGHTDVTGSPVRNQELSKERADAVRQYLVSKGVDRSRLDAKGYGSSQLADPSDPGAEANRRVEARPLS